nr:retrovirus-related Pol polyprotein from transposon TNT 1-94 [Tanacetum cinerariifolium]
MTTLAEHIIVAGAENRPPMLEKSMYDSWASRIRLFIKGKKNAMAFLFDVASRFLPSNNQLRTSSNPRNQATIQDRRVIVQQIQRRQTQSFVGTRNKGIATTSRGNYAAGQAKTEGLDAYDSDCDDISLAKAVLVVNLSSCNSDVLSELNKIKEDFGKRFVTQKELSIEQAFWLKHSNYNPDTPVKSHTPVRIEAPSELPKFVENSDLNAQLQEKLFAIAALKNELRELKGKNVVDTVVSKPIATISPGIFRNDHIANIMGYGDYQIRNVTISRVYYVEGLGRNLFSVGQFCDSDLEVAFRKHTCFIRNLEGVDLLKGSRGSNLYTLSLDNLLLSSPICLLSKASKTKSWLWHQRLSHLNFDYITFLAKQGLVQGLPKLRNQKYHLCSACALGKSKKHFHKPKAKDSIKEKLYLLHMDLYRLIRIQSINERKYILVIIDDYSRVYMGEISTIEG